VDGVSVVAGKFAQERKSRAETELLRAFFLRWCEMHRRCADKNATTDDKLAAAQDLTDQAHKLKAFYG
jgi:hypothetical protein